jgi:hypothetical protein
MTRATSATEPLRELYEALSDADREAVDVRRGLGEDPAHALAGVGLLLAAPSNEADGRVRQVVAEGLGVELAGVDVDGQELTTVRPPSREAAAIVAAAAGEWARLHGGHLVPDDWRALLAATDTSHPAISAARQRARNLLINHRDHVAPPAKRRAREAGGARAS